MAQRVGLVLAGGFGRRMGRTKGDLPYGDGGTLAERAARTLWPFCGSVLISVAPGSENPAAAFPAIEDRPPAGRGPLAGIGRAFDTTGDSDLLVLACDYPAVEEGLLRTLLAHARPEDDLVMPTDPRGYDHPLVGLWSRRTEHEVRLALDRNRLKVRALLASWQVRRLGPDWFPGLNLNDALRNFNRVGDLDQTGP
jgi:molybdopterin-guanine dinucleotide biosynthesis protein A